MTTVTVTDPLTAAVLFILAHLENTAVGPTGQESAIAGRFKQAILENLMPVSPELPGVPVVITAVKQNDGKVESGAAVPPVAKADPQSKS